MKNNTPKLRFKEFTDEWQEKKLGEVCDYKNGGSFEDRVVEGGRYNLITLNSIDIDGKIKRGHKTVNQADWFLQKDDLIMVLSDVAHGNFLGLSDVIPENNKYVLNQRMGLIRKTDCNVNLRFLQIYINKKQKYFKLHGQGSSQQNLSKGDILKFKIPTPVIEEQEKIAEFLTAVDKKINKIEEKKKGFEKYKKGVMQAIFSQKIRFRKSDGSNYPDWEKKTLEEICLISTAPYVEVNQNQRDGYCLIDMGSVSASGKLSFSKRTCSVKDILNRGDLVMPNRDIGHGDIIGKVAEIDHDNKYVLGNNMFCLRSNNNISSRYLFFAINSQEINRDMRKKSNGTSQLQLIRKDVDSQNIPVPSISEQEKIAEFLTSLDNRVELINKELGQTKLFKKALLQQMFV